MIATKNKISKATFKHIESEWYKYHETKKEVSRLRDDLLNGRYSSDENIGGGRSSTIGQPTEMKAIRIASHKQLIYMTDVINAIESVYNIVPDNYKRVAIERYWSNHNKSWDIVADSVNYSRRQCINIRDEIILATAELLGWR